MVEFQALHDVFRVLTGRATTTISLPKPTKTCVVIVEEELEEKLSEEACWNLLAWEGMFLKTLKGKGSEKTSGSKCSRRSSSSLVVVATASGYRT